MANQMNIEMLMYFKRQLAKDCTAANIHCVLDDLIEWLAKRELAEQEAQ